MKKSYKSLVHQNINCNIDPWLGASKYMLKKVRIIQRKSFRAVFNLLFNDHTNYFSKENFTLKLDDIYKCSLSISIFHYLNYQIFLRDLTSSCISFNLVNHEYQSRTISSLSVNRFNRTASQSSYVC